MIGNKHLKKSKASKRVVLQQVRSAVLEKAARGDKWIMLLETMLSTKLSKGEVHWAFSRLALERIMFSRSHKNGIDPGHDEYDFTPKIFHIRISKEDALKRLK